MGMMELRRRIIAGARRSEIPGEYQKVDYVIGQGAGSNFYTGISGDNPNLRFELSFEPDRFSAYFGFFGNYIDGNTNGWRLIFPGAGYNDRILYDIGKKCNTTGKIEVGASIIGKKIDAMISANLCSATIDGVTYTGVDPTWTDGTANTGEIVMGYTYKSTASTQGVRTKWYSFKIYDDGALVRNYVPCYRKSDNAVGFYDTVGKTFEQSTGPLAFVLN